MVKKTLFLMTCVAGSLFSLGASAQDIQLIKLDQLEQIIGSQSPELKVINFWASWCGPCVKELPYFNQLSHQKGVKVYLVSLDFPQDLSKAKATLTRKGITAPAFLLDEKDANKYITQINDSWSGAIPATLFVTGQGEKKFYESEFEEQQLQDVVTQLTLK